MGSRRVLGNDPFQRGAAERTPPPAKASPAEEAPGSKATRAADASSHGAPGKATGRTAKGKAAHPCYWAAFTLTGKWQ